MITSGLQILQKAAEYVRERLDTNPYTYINFRPSRFDPDAQYGLYFEPGIDIVFNFSTQKEPTFEELWENGEEVVAVKSSLAQTVAKAILAMEGIKQPISRQEWLDMTPNQIAFDVYRMVLGKVPEDKILGIKKIQESGEEEDLLSARLLDKDSVIKKVNEADLLVSQGINLCGNPYNIYGGLVKLAFPLGFCEPQDSEYIHILLDSTPVFGCMNVWSHDLDEVNNLLPATILASEAITHVSEDLEKLMEHYSAVCKKKI